MKYLVASDLHGSLGGYELLQEIFARELPDKTVLLGDLSRYGFLGETERAFLRETRCLPIAVQGNCDRDDFSACPELDARGEYYCDVIGGKTLFFTHGHRYNAGRLPPFLAEGDVLVYGHTHCALLGKMRGIIVANCGSLGAPRDEYGRSYIIIDESGITAKDADGNKIDKINF